MRHLPTPTYPWKQPELAKEKREKPKAKFTMFKVKALKLEYLPFVTLTIKDSYQTVEKLNRVRSSQVADIHEATRVWLWPSG